MRIAVIDLGTNTFNLLVAETIPGGQFETLYNERLPVQLGEGGINKGVITPAAFRRGIEAMDNYASAIRQWKVQKTLAFATSALRNASNGMEFVDIVKERTGIEISIISGEREAEYISIGVRQAVKLGEKPSLIIDIGGGSTEFIIASKGGVLWKRSFEIGASRLLQRFTPSDPITEDEKITITAYILQTLEPLWETAERINVTELIGASGSFESLAEMIDEHFHSLPGLDDRTECELDLQQCAFIHTEILASTREQRFKMRGLVAMRVDMIVVSAILVETVLNRLNIPKLRYSAYAMKEGVLWAFLNS